MGFFSLFAPQALTEGLSEWPTSRHVSPTRPGPFIPRKDLFRPGSSSNELDLNYFPKSLFWALLDTRRPEIREKSDCLEIQRNSSM